MTEATERLKPYRRNDTLESLLSSLASALETSTRPEKHSPELPALFIVGPPRTGSTYCLQWLSASGAFTYPSNFIARFWTAPSVGAMVQEMIVNPDFDHRGEFSDIQPQPLSGTSDVGKTKGMLAPSEFWYFWRHHLPVDGDLGIDLSAATSECYASFRRELGQLCDVKGRPAVMKGKIVNHQILSFAEGFEKALFLFMDRDPLDAAWSLLKARRRIYGDESRWWSFRTPNYDQLVELPPLEQVVGHVQSIRRDVMRQLSELPTNRWLQLDYAELCSQPDIAFTRISNLFAANGITIKGDNVMPPSRPSTRGMPTETLDQLKAALEQFQIEGVAF